MKHVHGVDLFERTALCLNHEEVDNEEEDDDRNSEDQSVEVVDLVGDHGGEEGDQEVEEPIRGCSQTHTGGAVTCGIEFSNDGPDEWSPGGCESSDEKTCEDNHDVSSLGCAQGILVVELEVADEGVDEKAYCHPRSSAHHGLATAYVLDDPETKDSSDDVDGTKNDGCDVGVGKTGRGEDRSTIVEEAREVVSMAAQLDKTGIRTSLHQSAADQPEEPCRAMCGTSYGDQ